MRHFRKRFYTPRAFGRDALALLMYFPDLLSAVVSRRVSRALAEKIMLAVTAANECRYCSYVHVRTARRAGVSALEVQRLLSGERRGLLEEEAVALAFAGSYAQTSGQPAPEEWQRLRSFYGSRVARDISSYVRLIYFANLCGNAVDAFLSRLKGRPAPGSNPLSEAALFVLLAPFTLPLLPFMPRAARSASGV